MTEEDTFLKLKRIPYQEMRDLWIRAFYSMPNSEIEDFFKQHGWTTDAYTECSMKLYHSR